MPPKSASRNITSVQRSTAETGASGWATATTRDVEVGVESFFMHEQSEDQPKHYRFGYHIRLRNLGAETVQLLRRSWIITDSSGKISHVEGAGVVGEQPVLDPGQEYEYLSGCMLSSPMGTMEGSYLMVNEQGENFHIRIPCFTLAVPNVIN